jgi:hypothetical protein
MLKCVYFLTRRKNSCIFLWVPLVWETLGNVCPCRRHWVWYIIYSRHGQRVHARFARDIDLFCTTLFSFFFFFRFLDLIIQRSRFDPMSIFSTQSQSAFIFDAKVMGSLRSWIHADYNCDGYDWKYLHKSR